MKTSTNTEQIKNLYELGFSDSNCKYIKNDIFGPAAFTISDFLEILPKEIKIDDKIYQQIILWSGQSYFSGYRIHDTDEWLYQSTMKDEMLDSLYEVVIWYYGKFLKK
ncbi:MAG: hypothetical protein J1F35_05925 [Erysipelotrichales bacterium]|nr:hypothetical protein [Erysipelotrichales bacterium]